MQDFYLRFSDEAQAQEVLYTPVYAPDPESTPEDPLPDVIVSWTPNYVNIDTIGVIYQPAPAPDPEGYVPVPYDGWFVNVRVVDGENEEPLLIYSIDPQPYPIRIWA